MAEHDTDRLVDVATTLRDEVATRLEGYGLQVPARRLVAWHPAPLESEQLLVSWRSTGTHPGNFVGERSALPTHPARTLRMALFEVIVVWDDSSEMARTNPISRMGASSEVIEQASTYGLQLAWTLSRVLNDIATVGLLSRSADGVLVGDVVPIEDMTGPWLAVSVMVDVLPIGRAAS